MNSKPALGRPATQNNLYDRVNDLEKALSEVAEELESISCGTFEPYTEARASELAKQIRRTIGEKVE
jgi:hypothetical protein